MGKQRTNLTPEEVQEFKPWVEFKNTACVWLLRIDGKLLFIDRKNGEDVLMVANNYGESATFQEMISAPNLQEVLEVLPKQILKDGNIYTYCFGYSHVATEPYVEYIELSKQNKSLHFEVYDDIIGAHLNMLRWVIENHPETLTKTE